MASNHRDRRTRCLAAILLLIGWALAPVAQSAPPYVLPGGSHAPPPATPVDPPQAAAPRLARTHVLVELRPGADETRFLAQARAQGLRRLGRVYGTRWITMALPANPGPVIAAQMADPRAAAAALEALPDVVRATPDVMLQSYQQVPLDPLYIFDDDPSTKPACDPCAICPAPPAHFVWLDANEKQCCR